jgi:hypothetical protein
MVRHCINYICFVLQMNFDSRIVASDFQYPTIAVWDTRANQGLPLRELRLGPSRGKATCVQYSECGSD